MLQWQSPGFHSALLCGLEQVTAHLPEGRSQRCLGPICCDAPRRRPAQRSAWRRGSPQGLQVMVSPTPADTCEADCVRQRAEQSLQAAIRTLRKSISRQQFSIQVAGTEYEVAQRPAKAPEGQGACSTGQVPRDSKCGESIPRPALSLRPRAAGEAAHAGGDRSTGTARERHRRPCCRALGKAVPHASFP